MPNLVKSARNIIEFIEKNEVVSKYEDEYSESHEYSQAEKLKELIKELNEAIDASTELRYLSGVPNKRIAANPNSQ